jgi:hypothetical protein
MAVLFCRGMQRESISFLLNDQLTVLLHHGSVISSQDEAKWVSTNIEGMIELVLAREE